MEYDSGKELIGQSNLTLFGVSVEEALKWSTAPYRPFGGFVYSIS